VFGRPVTAGHSQKKYLVDRFVNIDTCMTEETFNRILNEEYEDEAGQAALFPSREEVAIFERVHNPAAKGPRCRRSIARINTINPFRSKQ